MDYLSFLVFTHIVVGAFFVRCFDTGVSYRSILGLHSRQSKLTAAAPPFFTSNSSCRISSCPKQERPKLLFATQLRCCSTHQTRPSHNFSWEAKFFFMNLICCERPFHTHAGRSYFGGVTWPSEL